MALPIVSREERLEREIRAATECERYKSECFAKPGAGRTHDRIGMQIHLLIEQHLVGKNCEIFGPNVPVLAPSKGLSTYPDLTVVCEPAQFTDGPTDTLMNPTLLIDIVPPTTENWDRGHKEVLFRSIPSLKEFLLIAQGAYDVDVYRRQSENVWTLIPTEGLEATVELETIGLTIALRDIYKRVIAAADHEQA